MKKVIKWLVLVGLVVVAACGDDSSSGGSGDGIDAATFAAGYCALLKPCCTSAGLPVSDQKGCRAFFGAVPAKSPQLAKQCLDAYTAAANEPEFCSLQTPQPEACKAAYPSSSSTSSPTSGKTPAGGSCSASSDCATSGDTQSVCAPIASPQGTCRQTTRAKAGDLCQGNVETSTVTIMAELQGTTVPFCYRDDGVTCESGVCAAIGGVGDPCKSDAMCPSNTYCNGEKCAEKLPTGSSCADSPSACSDSAYCEFSGMKCLAKKADGETCEVNTNCLSAYCDGTCKKPSGLGSLALVPFCQ